MKDLQKPPPAATKAISRPELPPYVSNSTSGSLSRDVRKKDWIAVTSTQRQDEQPLQKAMAWVRPHATRPLESVEDGQHRFDSDQQRRDDYEKKIFENLRHLAGLFTEGNLDESQAQEVGKTMDEIHHILRRVLTEAKDTQKAEIKRKDQLMHAVAVAYRQNAPPSTPPPVYLPATNAPGSPPPSPDCTGILSKGLVRKDEPTDSGGGPSPPNSRLRGGLVESLARNISHFRKASQEGLPTTSPEAPQVTTRTVGTHSTWHGHRRSQAPAVAVSKANAQLGTKRPPDTSKCLDSTREPPTRQWSKSPAYCGENAAYPQRPEPGPVSYLVGYEHPPDGKLLAEEEELAYVTDVHLPDTPEYRAGERTNTYPPIENAPSGSTSDYGSPIGHVDPKMPDEVAFVLASSEISEKSPEPHSDVLVRTSPGSSGETPPVTSKPSEGFLDTDRNPPLIKRHHRKVAGISLPVEFGLRNAIFEAAYDHIMAWACVGWTMITIYYTIAYTVFDMFFKLFECACLRFERTVEHPFPPPFISRVPERAGFIAAADIMTLGGTLMLLAATALWNERSIWLAANGLTREYFIDYVRGGSSWSWMAGLNPKYWR